jgi:hypothetical protein
VRVSFRGVYAVEGKGFAEIPEGASLRVIRNLPGEQFTVVDWNGCEFLVFLKDLMERAIIGELLAA